jgi:hypothetical protein
MGGDARKAFLTRLIDDAGLFPPASLSMADAVAAHRASRQGASGWLLGRFICLASRLPELAAQLGGHGVRNPWSLSVILDGATGERWLEEAISGLASAREFSSRMEGRTSVDLLEGLLPPEADLPLVRKFTEAVENSALPRPVTPFLEVPRDAELPHALEVIAQVRDELSDGGLCRPPGAKLRCGGASEDLFPAPSRVAAFIDTCNGLGIPFKATAGLHHPFRHVDSATGFTQHGFVNLLGAAILASAHGLNERELLEVVADDNPASFSLTAEGFSWRDRSATESEIAAARVNLFVSYGSCSFEEPVEDLTELGILPI